MDTDQLDEEQLYYKAKYFKYKLKYVALKKQLGGFISIDVDAIGKLVNDTGALITGAPNAQQQAQPQAKQRNKTLKELQEETQSEKLKNVMEDVLHREQNERIINYLVELLKNQKEMETFLLIRNKLLKFENNSSINSGSFKKMFDPKLKLYDGTNNIVSLITTIVSRGLEDFYIKDAKKLNVYLKTKVEDFIRKGGHLKKK